MQVFEIWKFEENQKYVKNANCINTQLEPWKMFLQVYKYTCYPNDPCFDYKRPCFWGSNPQNKGQMGSRYVYSHPIVSMFHDFEGFVWCMCHCSGKDNAFPGSNAVNVTVERCEWLSVRAKPQLCLDWSVGFAMTHQMYSNGLDVCWSYFNVSCLLSSCFWFVSIIYFVYTMIRLSSIFEGVRM